MSHKSVSVCIMAFRRISGNLVFNPMFTQFYKRHQANKSWFITNFNHNDGNYATVKLLGYGLSVYWSFDFCSKPHPA